MPTGIVAGHSGMVGNIDNGVEGLASDQRERIGGSLSERVGSAFRYRLATAKETVRAAPRRQSDRRSEHTAITFR